MKQCTSCRRHVRPAERVCPFCEEVLHAGEAPRFGVVVLLGALGAACVSRPSDGTATGEDSSGGGTAGASTSTAATTGGVDVGTSTGGSAGGTSSTGELTSSNDADTWDPGCSFYGGCPRDSGIPPKECDPFVQDCPPGEKCMPYDGGKGWGWDALKCVPVARDPAKPGEPCQVEGGYASGVDDCELGAVCWGADFDTGEGICVAQCLGTLDAPTCADPQALCVIEHYEALTVCLTTCDPLAQDCPVGQSCNFPGKDAFFCGFDASGDEGQEFDPCEWSNECDPGFTCQHSYNASECNQSQDCCVAWCDLTMPACNGAGATCLAFYDEGMAPPGLEDVGACVIPP